MLLPLDDQVILRHHVRDFPVMPKNDLSTASHLVIRKWPKRHPGQTARPREVVLQIQYKELVSSGETDVVEVSEILVRASALGYRQVKSPLRDCEGFFDWPRLTFFPLVLVQYS